MKHKYWYDDNYVLDISAKIYSVLPAFDRAQCQDYLHAHMAFAGESRQIFTDSAISAIFAYSGGLARKINKVATLALMAAVQHNSRSIDERLISLVIDQELSW